MTNLTTNPSAAFADSKPHYPLLLLRASVLHFEF